ncbi:MAG TPA: UDP-N-acetylmuramoyl-L-alanine--D-glutamate ligase [Armatimonadota bacterium]|jgi:UDP-N-acetylmuramoylalanine--D-glutamate ligase
MTSFRGRKVAVIGAARTGVAVARALVPLGAIVHVFDDKAEEDLPGAAEALRAAGASVTWGASDGPQLLAADIVVPSPGVWKTSPVLVAAADRGQTIWSEPEVAFRITAAPMVAVTGTNGKTTTTALIGRMLQDAGRDARVGGNIAPGIPLVEQAASAPASAILAAEISSFQLEWIDAFRPVVGVITNIAADHLNRHGSVDEYAAMKARLLENQTAADSAIVNADSARAVAAGKIGRGLVWHFSRRREVARGAFMRGHEIVLRDGGGETTIMDARNVRIPGLHNRENALAAVIAGRILGLSTDNIVFTLSTFAGVEHRMEDAGAVRGVRYINNSMCTNPAALAASIEALETRILVIVGGRDKALDFGPVEAAFRVGAKAVFSIGEHGPALAALARKAGVETVVESGDLATAVADAARTAREGDIVMLAPGCASMDQFQDFMDRGNQFKAAVKEMMEAA